MKGKHSIIFILLSAILISTVLSGCKEKDSNSTNSRIENQKVPDSLTEAQIAVLKEIASLQQSDNEEKELSTKPQGMEENAKALDVDYDFTGMNYNMMSALNFEMIVNSDEYLNKTIRYEGQFFTNIDPNNGKRYHSCLQYDETRCCQVGFDFIVPDSYVFPDDFPDEKSFVRVTGTYSCDENGGISHYYLLCDSFEIL